MFNWTHIAYTLRDRPTGVNSVSQSFTRAAMRHNSMAECQPNTVKAFTQAMRKSIEHLRANPAEARGLIAELASFKREWIEQIPINE
jgi:ABC-type nitrate/sulfonate/bicarbonate transport system substrate-binding protein